LPVFECESSKLEAGIAAPDLFRMAGLAQSNGEARRLIKGGGAKINDDRVENETRTVTKRDLGADGVIKLSSGKKRHVLVKLI